MAIDPVAASTQPSLADKMHSVCWHGRTISILAAGALGSLAIITIATFPLSLVAYAFAIPAICTAIYLAKRTFSFSKRKEEELPFPAFQKIRSSELVQLSSKKTIASRQDFLAAKDLPIPPPPLIGKSKFVSKEMVEHLMRHKKDSALGVKYIPGDKITNMEGALHTFVTPLCKILMTGDFRWEGKLQGNAFGKNQARPVILSAAIHPDFELDTVMMPLARLTSKAIPGEIADLSKIPSARDKKDQSFRTLYEEKLQKHMIYHLLSDHRLPALGEIRADQILDLPQAISFLENSLRNGSCQVKGHFVRIGSSVLSLELLFQVYIEQLRNELKILEAHTPQGYVYTVNPPSIFAQTLGGAPGARLLNRLQALAFQFLASEISHLKVLAFSDYADPEILPLLKRALPLAHVISKKDYTPNAYPAFAVVLHNNSDGFGQNIETEGPTSLDGVIGSYSNAACVLKRDRPDLLHFVY